MKNTATNIYERLGVNIKKSVEIAVGQIDFTFYLDMASYDALLNDLTDKNKVTPVKDYLLAIVEPTQRADLTEVLAIPALAMNLVQKVNDALIPNVELTVKN